MAESMPASEETFACPHCGSTQVRRSSPHGLADQLVRSFTPYHFFRCRACGRRGMYLGKRLSSRSRSGRPLESRDVRAAHKRRRRLLAAVVLSVGLGAAAGVYLNSCQQRAEQAQPPSQ